MASLRGLGDRAGYRSASMLRRTVSCVALHNRDYVSFEEKLREAVRWIAVAGEGGSDLVVLPESINTYAGDGGQSPPRTSDIVHESWQSSCEFLLDGARSAGVAVAIPLLVHENGLLLNRFYLMSREGECLGWYNKQHLPPGERAQGVHPGSVCPLMNWDGVRVGGAICFETWFPSVFESQRMCGANLILVPSLWPGGLVLNAEAIRNSIPIALAYPAWSRIIDIDGSEIASGGYRNETLRFGFGSPIVSSSINFNRRAVHADGAQQHIHDLQRAFGGRVGIAFNQPNCLFLIESLDADLNVLDVLERFGLQPFPEWFASTQSPFPAVGDR